jgi:hypothetical protein
MVIGALRITKLSLAQADSILFWEGEAGVVKIWY